MKIIDSKLTHELDALTIQNQNITSLMLMERAAARLTGQIVDIYNMVSAPRRIRIFCGGGNNGGDGFAMARMLMAKGLDVDCYALRCFSKYSTDCEANYCRLKSSAQMEDIVDEDGFPVISDGDIVIDAIFGSGLSRPIAGLSARLVRHINDSSAMVIAVDTPSGLPDCAIPDEANGPVIHADITITIQSPFISMLLPENQDFVGELRIVDIGLDGEVLQSMPSVHYLTTIDDIMEMYMPRGKFSHKGTFGHALIVAGSKGKGGAAVMCARACHRAGAGLVTAHIPGSLVDIMQVSSPETMVDADFSDVCISRVDDADKYSAIGIGPGLGTDIITRKALGEVLDRLSAGKRLVLDADALNIVAQNLRLLDMLPEDTIITPHPKEFERLFGPTPDSLSRVELARTKAMQHHIIIVLKGAHTAVCNSDGNVYFNTTGNPSMATAGSGDVLTGIITGLLSQRYSPISAAMMGVWLHGKAADMVDVPQGLIASDIIDALPRVFRLIVDRKAK